MLDGWAADRSWGTLGLKLGQRFCPRTSGGKAVRGLGQRWQTHERRLAEDEVVSPSPEGSSRGRSQERPLEVRSWTKTGPGAVKTGIGKASPALQELLGWRGHLHDEVAQ